MNRQTPFEEVYTPSGVAPERSALYVGPTLSRRRILVLSILIAAVFALFGLRSFQLTVLEHDAWQRRASRNRTRAIVLPAARGEIRDRNGTILATNTPKFAVVVFPDQLPKNLTDRALALETIGKQLNSDSAELARKLSEASGDYVVVEDSLTREQALPLMSSLSPAYTSVLFRPEREYLDGNGKMLLGNLLGFTGRVGKIEYAQRAALGYRFDDLLGKQGIEKEYETTLRGSHGELVYEVGADGSIQTEISQTPARAGQDVTLTIDAGLEQRIARAIARFAPGKNGAVVVVDTNTGALRALVSFPDYSPNLFSANSDPKRLASLLSDPRRPLFSRAVSGQYPSGSTIKPFFAIGALSDGIVSATTTIMSRGGIRIADSFFPDWKAGGHGRTNVSTAIAESVNSFFYLIFGGYPLSDGQYPQRKGVGVERMENIAKAFGFGALTGVDVPGEQEGFFPTPLWKQDEKKERWYIGDTYHLAIGQGDLLVTPLQLAVATARVANNGRGYRPFIVESAAELQPLLPTGFTAESFRVVQEAMRKAVTYGSARALADLPIAVAGKTGTAQWHTTRSPHSWFIGYAPYQKPAIALSVIVEEGGEGSGPALSIAKEIFQWYADEMKQDKQAMRDM